MAHKTIVSEQFIQYLRKGRTDFNSLFTKYSVLNKSVSIEEFSETLYFLTDALQKNPGCPQITFEIFSEYYEVALQLTEKRVLSSGKIYINFRENFAKIISLIPVYLLLFPKQNMHRLVSALKSIQNEKSTNIVMWISLMSEIALATEYSDIFYKGIFVAAWRCGAALYRESALHTLGTLPENITAAIFGVKGKSSTEVAAFLLANPLQPADSLVSHPKNKTELVKRFIGDFSGFGGQFITPPVITCENEDVFLTDDRQTFRLHADAYGYSLTSDEKPLRNVVSDKPFFKNAGNSAIRSAAAEYFIKELSYNGKMVSTANMAVIGFLNSHKIMLIYEKGSV